ncbi:hypothetical protein [Luethyella okanaganae]|uniref:Uncharacterized protein n=1 Tax=Luethyella okanaganae TaxID=69372 RepID=A0ABW1VCX1_9MICO
MSRPTASERRVSCATRALLLAAGALAAVGMLLVAPAASDASWADAEQASSGTLQALTVPAPVITSCTAKNVLIVGAQVDITWTIGGGYTSTNVSYAGGASLLSLLPISIGSGVTTTGPVGGVYSTRFQGGLLSGALGGDVYLVLQTQGPGGWTSKQSYVIGTLPVLVGTGSCSIHNG